VWNTLPGSSAIGLKNTITRPTFQIFSDGAFRKLGSAKFFTDSRMASLITNFNFVEFFNQLYCIFR
jgi:hypothetical protein